MLHFYFCFCQLSNTKDMVVKKMVFQFLCKYGLENPELAIMCVNTLRQDCKHEDPMVRGLALRSLCGLRVADLVEYMVQPLQVCKVIIIYENYTFYPYAQTINILFRIGSAKRQESLRAQNCCNGCRQNLSRVARTCGRFNGHLVRDDQR